MFNLPKQRPPVLALAGDSFSTWIGTNTSSRKVAHVQRDPRVCLYYADTDTFEGLTLQGTVEEVHDLSIRAEIWTNDWNMYYPGGQEGGDFTLLRFHPIHGRYYQGLRVVEFDAEQSR
jgi:general stress protein 26